ncbi:hypothetical protein Ddye_004021 [Dipteronia dyeriana]|uniref:Uncharacterized protein n=1 Tax=Dipteronia dyeriana TaxID=168575 RepID=A0AAD9XUJ4_9ROSI|nr:hypothetical protein Ddye_004021 [Dipteronia dyeriana]
MDDEAAKALARKVNHREYASTLVILLRILLPVFIFLWIMHSGFELVTEPRKFPAFAAWTFHIGTSLAFHIGVVTMLFGFLALILGLPLLADLCLNLLHQVQVDTGKPRDLISTYLFKMDDEPAKATKTTYKVVARISVAMVTLFMLLWSIHTGYRLATEPRRDSKYYFLTTSIGILSIIFGLTYFIIGLAIIVELGLDLFAQLQQKQRKAACVHQGCDTADKSFV